MKNNSKYGLLTILLFFFAAITLGGLGYAGAKEASFYWFPFIVNLGVYGTLIYKCYKKSQEV